MHTKKSIYIYKKREKKKEAAIFTGRWAGGFPIIETETFVRCEAILDTSCAGPAVFLRDESSMKQCLLCVCLLQLFLNSLERGLQR